MVVVVVWGGGLKPPSPPPMDPRLDSADVPEGTTAPDGASVPEVKTSSGDKASSESLKSPEYTLTDTQTVNAANNGQTDTVTRFKVPEVKLLPEPNTKKETEEEGPVFFFGKLSFLSNFHDSQASVHGRIFKTSEHAFQYLRATLVGRPDIAEQIASVDRPGEAKRLGKTVTVPAEMQSSWRSIMESAMETVVTSKFQLNEEAKKLLQLVSGT